MPQTSLAAFDPLLIAGLAGVIILSFPCFRNCAGSVATLTFAQRIRAVVAMAIQRWRSRFAAGRDDLAQAQPPDGLSGERSSPLFVVSQGDVNSIHAGSVYNRAAGLWGWRCYMRLPDGEPSRCETGRIC